MCQSVPVFWCLCVLVSLCYDVLVCWCPCEIFSEISNVLAFGKSVKICICLANKQHTCKSWDTPKYWPSVQRGEFFVVVFGKCWQWLTKAGGGQASAVNCWQRGEWGLVNTDNCWQSGGGCMLNYLVVNPNQCLYAQRKDLIKIIIRNP